MKLSEEDDPGSKGTCVRPFFLTGLPRSRTAWLANLFTTGEIFCWHDALLLCGSPADLPQLLRKNAPIGDSDSALILFYPDVAEMFPGSPWVIVERDPQDAFDSLVKRFGHDVSRGGWPMLIAAMQTIPKDDPNVLRVRYEELNDVEVVRRIWEHCVPAVEFDERRWALLKRLNVERIPPSSDPARERSMAQELFNRGSLS